MGGLFWNGSKRFVQQLTIVDSTIVGFRYGQ